MKVFIRMECVSPTVPQSDKPVDDACEGSNASRAENAHVLQQIKGNSRPQGKGSLAMDVVFHPGVIRFCRSEWWFRDLVMTPIGN